MKVIKVPIEKLKKPEKNVRLHSEKQINEFIRSVKKFGQIRPIVVDDEFTMLAGNGLYEALKQMGRNEAEVLVMPGLTEKDKKKLMLADNRIFNLGSDDMDVFDEFIASFGDDFDIPGFDEDLIRTLNASAEAIDEMIAGYGKFDEQAVQSMLSAAENNAENEKSSGSPLESSGIGFQPSPNMEAYVPQKPLEDPQERLAEDNAAAVPGRYIICPKCGERIFL